jgi:hypothetical protein
MMQLLRKLTHPFSLSLADLRKTQFSQLTSRSLLILNGPDTHKYPCLDQTAARPHN